MTASPPTIAVLDDDEAVRKAICRLLRSAGYSTRAFASGAEFLERCLQRPPDCVVLDLQMPGMSGLEVQTHVNRMRSRPAIVFITAHDGPMTQQQCLEGGAAAYLRKPVDGKTLLSTLRGALAAASAH